MEFADATRIPLTGVTEGADTIRFTLSRSALPAEFSEEFSCMGKIGDWTGGGRTFVIDDL